MPERRLTYLDLAAAGLLLAGLLVALAVLSDEPDVGVNLLGSGGAALAGGLHDLLGVAVHGLLASWFVLVVMLFLRRSVLRWSLRLAGWLVLVPGMAVTAAFLGADDAGGRLGTDLAALLVVHFPPWVRALLYAAGISLGLHLAFDFLFVGLVLACWRLLRRVVRIGARLCGMGFHQWKESLVQDQGENEDAEENANEEEEVEEEEEELAVIEAPATADVPIHHAEAPLPPARELRVVPIVRPAPEPGVGRYDDFELPPLTLLDDPQPCAHAAEHDQKLRERAALLEKTFADFSLNVRVVGINTGPVITQYEVALETGLRVHKVTSLADDLALNLKVPSVRMVAPIPGKNTVGVEIPNDNRAIVRLKEVILTGAKKTAKMKVPLFLGKDTEGRPLIYDLAEMPHLLIAGRTGTGKSVCMNGIILSMLMTRRPDEVKMIMIDPKMLEMSEYGRIPHLMHPVVKDMKKAEAILSWAVDKMEERYDILSRARVRNVASYNELSLAEVYRRVQPADDEDRRRIPDKMPYIVIFIDELADLMMQLKKEVEGHIIRLAQKSRAAGIHLVVATQKPTVDVITGLIKSNLPARICFQVSSRSDSRVVLDEMGADKLLGKGDLLFLQPNTSTLIRAQGAYASDEEISRVVGHLECDPDFAEELVKLNTAGSGGKGSFLENIRARDDIYEQAIEVVVREGRGSVSLLQRALGIGYGRAARLVDYMAEDGIVGTYAGSQAREVLFTPEQWREMKESDGLKESA